MDDVMARTVARRIYFTEDRREGQLVRAVRAAFIADGAATPSDVEPRYQLAGWTRPPGGVDLTAEPHDGSGTIGMEMKVGKPEEGIWDAIKLADVIAESRDVVAAYLIYGGHKRIWDTRKPVAALFLEPPSQITARELISRWPAAWRDLLLGGRGIRPITSSGSLQFSLVGSYDASVHADHQIKVLRVQGGKDISESYDRDGWPLGYEPPSTMRANQLDSERRQRRPPKTAPSPAELDACHGYAWYTTWSQARLRDVVPRLNPAAFACLRHRLKVERGWREDELRDRVDPLHEG